MGVTVRQKVKGRGKPWWVFVAHNGKRTSKQVGDKEAAEKVASAIRARIKKGDFGIEPCSYVIGKDAVDVAKKVISISEKI